MVCQLVICSTIMMVNGMFYRLQILMLLVRLPWLIAMWNGTSDLQYKFFWLSDVNLLR